MFRGFFEHSIDPKGRLAIPAHFRDVLSAFGDARLVITTGLSEQDSYLEAYPVSKWEELEEKVRQLPQFDPRVQQFRRLYIASASECSLDKQGRILLPPLLREEASIDRDVIIAGDVEKIQIWPREAWTKSRKRDQASLKEVQETMANLGL